MPETLIGSAVASDLTNTQTYFSVDTKATDGASDQKETRLTNEKYSKYLGYYKEIPELKSTINTKGKWVIGKGVKGDKATMKIMDNWRGWGKDTKNTLIKNCNNWQFSDDSELFIKVLSGKHFDIEIEDIGKDGDIVFSLSQINISLTDKDMKKYSILRSNYFANFIGEFLVRKNINNLGKIVNNGFIGDVSWLFSIYIIRKMTNWLEKQIQKEIEEDPSLKVDYILCIIFVFILVILFNIILFLGGEFSLL